MQTSDDITDPRDHPIYDALVRLGTNEMTVRSAALTRDKYAALLDSPAVSRYVGPLASDDQRARQASEEIKEAVASVASPRDRLIGEAVLCTREDFEGRTVGERKYRLADWPGMQITNDVYREGRLRVLLQVFEQLREPPRRQGISGTALLIPVVRAGVILQYACLAEQYRLTHDRENLGVSRKTWRRFSRVSHSTLFYTFLSLVMLEDEVNRDHMHEQLSPTSRPGSIAELCDLVTEVSKAGPLEYHHIQAACGLRYWRGKPPVDIPRHLYDNVWGGWYDRDTVGHVTRLLTVSVPFSGYAEKYCHMGAIVTYQGRQFLHDHFKQVPDYGSLQEHLQESFLQHSDFPDITYEEYWEKLAILDYHEQTMS